jgi:hypothetical protein
MRTNLFALAHGRSGDKGDTVNVGVIARHPDFYAFLCDTLSTERVKRHFGDLVKGDVQRFELPNLHALNFLLHEALGGGGTVSLMTDAQGKTFSTAMLRMEVDLPDELAPLLAKVAEQPLAASPPAQSVLDAAHLRNSHGTTPPEPASIWRGKPGTESSS